MVVRIVSDGVKGVRECEAREEGEATCLVRGGVCTRFSLVFIIKLNLD